MKITQIIIKGFQQFRDFRLDLTDDNGKPLDRVCFIGKNGTGKTTLLEALDFILADLFHEPFFWKIRSKNVFIFLKIQNGDEYFYVFRTGGLLWTIFNKYPFLKESQGIDFIKIFEASEWKNWVDDWVYRGDENKLNLLKELLQKVSHGYQFYNIHHKSFIAFSPTEDAFNPFKLTNDIKKQLNIGGHTGYDFYNNLPNTNLNEALDLFKNFPVHHTITERTISDFWKLLIYNVKKRDEEFKTYAESHQDLSYAQIKANFNRENPNILDGLAELWNNILAEAGLEFDVEKAKNPIQLTDNLQAYIRRKGSKDGDSIAYHELSTGIRNFIFKVGYLYALYFNRKIENGFLLIDEPENSLYPSFIKTLMDTYNKIIEGGYTQFFVATHSPLVAAQFEPQERVILEFDEQGYVTAHKGSAPIGDDTNDILINDFGTDVYQQHDKAVKAWKRFVELQQLIVNEQDKDKKKPYIKEYLQLANQYKFSPRDEVSK